MVDTNNYNKDTKKGKPCKFLCGKLIHWNNEENAYFEVDSEQKHTCPNWKPRITKSQEQGSQQTVKILDTNDQILAEILLKVDRIEQRFDELKGH